MTIGVADLKSKARVRKPRGKLSKTSLVNRRLKIGAKNHVATHEDKEAFRREIEREANQSCHVDKEATIRCQVETKEPRRVRPSILEFFDKPSRNKISGHYFDPLVLICVGVLGGRGSRNEARVERSGTERSDGKDRREQPTLVHARRHLVGLWT